MQQNFLSDEEIIKQLDEYESVFFADKELIGDEYKEKLFQFSNNGNTFAMLAIGTNYFDGINGFPQDTKLGYSYLKKANELSKYDYLSTMHAYLWTYNMLDEVIEENIIAIENGFTKNFTFVDSFDEENPEESFKEIFEYCYPRYLDLALNGSVGACIVLSKLYGEERFPGRSECGIKRDVLLSDYFKQLANKLKDNIEN